MQRWQQAARAGTAVEAQTTADVDEEDDMRDFIVPDNDDEEEEYERAEAAYDEELSRHAASSHTRIRLQVKSSSSSSSSSKKKKPSASSASSASASSSVPPSSSKQQRRLEAKVSAKQAFKVQQQERRQKRERGEMTEVRSVTLGANQSDVRTPPPAATAVAPPPPPPRAATPDVIVIDAATSIQPTASTHATLPAQTTPTAAAAPPTQPTAAPAASVPAADSRSSAPPRKRRRLIIDDDDEHESSRQSEMERLVASIEDADESDDDGPSGARGLSSADAIVIDEPEVKKRDESCTPRNFIGMLEAVRANDVPFGGAQRARLHRLRAQRAAEAAAAGGEAEVNGEGIISSRALMASDSDYASATPAVGFPFYASSGFRAAQVLHQGLLRTSLRSLWSQVCPVADWSLCGTFGPGVSIHARPLAAAGISYVNSLDFDVGGVLLAASSNTARVNIYDFESIWLAGRGVEIEKRARMLRHEDEKVRFEELIARPVSPSRGLRWTLNRPAPQPPAPPARRPHEYMTPIFSMDLHPDARGSQVNAAGGGAAAATLRQIDSQQWNPHNHNELALASQRNNQIFMSAAP